MGEFGERFFATLTDKQTPRGVFTSVPRIEKCLREYLRSYNEAPRPLVWTKSVKEIVDKVGRARGAHSPILHNHYCVKDTTLAPAILRRNQVKGRQGARLRRARTLDAAEAVIRWTRERAGGHRRRHYAGMSRLSKPSSQPARSLPRGERFPGRVLARVCRCGSAMCFGVCRVSTKTPSGSGGSFCWASPRPAPYWPAANQAREAVLAHAGYGR